MKNLLEQPRSLAEKVLAIEVKLEVLEQELQEIGQPAANGLYRRLEALKIESKALKRNLVETQYRQQSDHERLKKLETLLRHIEDEESAVESEADFLNQAAPSSITLAVEAGSHMVDLYRRGLKRVLGNHHPLGSSVFVNQTHANLVSVYGLDVTESATLYPNSLK
ncbi:MAG: hypothetical protein WCL19_09510 [Verrucomicrobiota bacterium]